jgi:FKBP-type peptidyl-prolyl cis-trans isomerase
MINLKSISILFLCSACLFASCQNSNISNTKIATQDDSASYMYGVLIGTTLKGMGFDGLNVNGLAKGISESVAKKEGLPTDEQISQYLNQYFGNIQTQKSKKNLEEGRAFLEKNKSKEGVVTLESGMQYQILTEGTGPKPIISDTVKVNYHGTLIDGTVFDSSVDRGEPVTFGLDMVIPAWQQVLPMMNKGSKWKVWVPTELAYGENVRPGGVIEPNAALIFEIELLDINPSAEQPAVAK